MKFLFIALVVQLSFQISFCEDGSLEENVIHLDENDISDKIYGGQSVQRNQFQYVARLSILFASSQKTICTGVVINSRTILTVAHCVVRPGNTKARFVSARIQGGGQYIFNTNEIYIHPNYNFLYSTDIAVLQMDPSRRNVMRNFGTPPALPPNLTPDGYTPYVGDVRATLLGYGLTNNNNYNNNAIIPRLHSANVTIQSTDAPTECDSHYGDLTTIDERMLCTYNNIAGLCEGDWGGPLLVDNTLVGLGMFKRGGCTNLEDFPSAFVDVQYVVRWLRESFSL